MRRTLALVVLASLFSFASVAAAQAPILVFVTSAGTANGFTDPSKDNRDTVKDLRESLSKFKADVRLVETRDEAQIVLTVQDREFGQARGGLAIGSAESRDYKIRVKFQAGAQETELVAVAASDPQLAPFTGGAWSKAAGKIAKQVREWAIANRAQLAAPK
jgi:hypothetical protein